MKKALHHLIFLLASVLLLATMGCNTEPKTYVIKGEVIVQLHEDIVDEKLKEFITNYSQYQFVLKNFTSPRLNIYLFRFNYRMINQAVFVQMLNDDERVREASSNTRVFPDD